MYIYGRLCKHTHTHKHKHAHLNFVSKIPIHNCKQNALSATPLEINAINTILSVLLDFVKGGVATSSGAVQPITEPVPRPMVCDTGSPKVAERYLKLLKP